MAEDFDDTVATTLPPVAADIAHGTARCLIDMGYAPVAELPLANGRRADITAIDRKGHVVIVEIKSSRADFLSDRKWPDYLEFCDAFYFAVAPGFPRELLPQDEGLILAERFQGAIERPAVLRPMAAARRKALLLRFARLAALRLQGQVDPLAAL
ncbi:MmcB family DNA repair protein [Marinivivus vitaminiproducens]|uniref:MmcB family DNA repair protein n=1 Tax=Marinivivus vitaminiproducens TaxID=3035935 RepID=UPI0027A22D8E|nr:MmcB family DNA repair protein [Geminicoccaceae bacterium SCSIO 64248]